VNTAASLTIKNRIPEIGRIWPFLDKLTADWSLPDASRHAVQLSLDELVTNIVSYGYVDNEEHDIELDFSINTDVLTIRLRDDARQFNPLEIPDPDIDAPLEERGIGGLGIFFVRNFMDKVEYRYDEPYNILTMKLTIKRESA
jgi:anti-sigma regulatory factor (Ser/Thr protein kinase)